MSTFYKVRKIGTQEFYDPIYEDPIYEDPYVPNFSAEGKRYVNLTEAREAVELCGNNSAYPCEVVHYIEDVLEVGVIQPNGKTKVALNQNPIPQRV